MAKFLCLLAFCAVASASPLLGGLSGLAPSGLSAGLGSGLTSGLTSGLSTLNGAVSAAQQAAGAGLAMGLNAAQQVANLGAGLTSTGVATGLGALNGAQGLVGLGNPLATLSRNRRDVLTVSVDVGNDEVPSALDSALISSANAFFANPANEQALISAILGTAAERDVVKKAVDNAIKDAKTRIDAGLGLAIHALPSAAEKLPAVLQDVNVLRQFARGIAEKALEAGTGLFGGALNMGLRGLNASTKVAHNAADSAANVAGAAVDAASNVAGAAADASSDVVGAAVDASSDVVGAAVDASSDVVGAAVDAAANAADAAAGVAAGSVSLPAVSLTVV